MSKRIRIILSVLLAATLLLGSFSALTGVADDKEEKKQELKDKISDLEAQISANQKEIEKIQDDINARESYANELSGQISALQQQIDALDQRIKMLDDEILALEKQINEKNERIAVLENDIIQAQNEITKCEQDIEKTYEILKTRLRSLYINGTTSEIEILMEAEDFATFLLNLELMNSVSRHDTAIVNEIKTQIKFLDDRKAQLSASIASLNEAKALLEEEKAELKVAEDELLEDRAAVDAAQAQIEKNWSAVNAIISELDAQSQAYKELNSKAEEEKDKFAKELDALISNRGSTGTGEMSEAGFIWPLQYKKTYITTTYGRNGHGGVDITVSSAQGKDISAVADGRVLVSAWHWSYGNYIVLDHGNGLTTYYAHCSALYVSEGESVSQGDVIGAVGNTGYSFGPHIHFEVRVNGSRRNPMNYLSMPSDAFYW